MTIFQEMKPLHSGFIWKKKQYYGAQVKLMGSSSPWVNDKFVIQTGIFQEKTVSASSSTPRPDVFVRGFRSQIKMGQLLLEAGDFKQPTDKLHTKYGAVKS